ncbi:uncharacterized protein IL334_003431 [Kwoniella shivajii]|uniref:Spindle pole body-associated protein cut12 domain-containing protein n=1 Tax=Kwoniella shivajii TaxID=564305 RepID=A0ABZ1CXJ2_9TREE|nr:hypothetical protein IL334_003431 [Kwoniella shivajii]
MVAAATRGDRSRFYNALARAAKHNETYRITSTHIEPFSPENSTSGSVPPESAARSTTTASRRFQDSLTYHDDTSKNKVEANDNDDHHYDDDDDDGWGSVPSGLQNQNRTNASKANEAIIARQVANEPIQDSKISLSRRNNPPVPDGTSERKEEEEKRAKGTRTPSPHDKVQSWVSSSTRTINTITPTKPPKVLHPDPYRQSFSQPTSKQRSFDHFSIQVEDNSDSPTRGASKQKPSKEDKMSYLVDEPGSYARKYMDTNQTNQNPLTDFGRPTYTHSNLNAEGRQRLSPHISSRIGIPSNLPSSNPFSATNIREYRNGEDGESINRARGHNVTDILEKERQNHLQRITELQKLIEEKNDYDSYQYRPNNTNTEGNETRILRQENTSLRLSLQTSNDIIKSAESRLAEMESRPSQHPSSSLELHEAKSEIDQLQIENRRLHESILSIDKELEDERSKRVKADYEAEGSKKSQSITAKSLTSFQNRVKELEEKLRIVEEKERVERERRDVNEKRIQTLETAKAQLEREYEAVNMRKQNAYREKETAISKYKATENQNTKLSDKLNLTRKEIQGLQARVEELMEELAQANESSKTDKSDVIDRKRLKEDLHRERETSDRLRSERNALRHQISTLKLHIRSKLSEPSEIHEPTPSEIHKPRFSLDSPVKLEYYSDKKDTVVEVAPSERPDYYNHMKDKDFEVIEDKTGKYAPQRITMEDVEGEETPKRSITSKPIEKPSSLKWTYSEAMRSLQPPKMTWQSQPLQPSKLDTPFKEGISLLHPELKVDNAPAVILSVADEQRPRWPDGYSDIEGPKNPFKIKMDKDELSSLSKDEIKVKEDPFADLDPLECSFSPKSPKIKTKVTMQSPSINERTLRQGLMDLLGSPQSIL